MYHRRDGRSRLVLDQDDSRIWHTIDCLGEFNEAPDYLNSPSDEAFKEYFEELNLMMFLN